MSEIPPYDDEIDLFELIETLWANKMAGVVFDLMRNAIANHQKRKANASQI